MKKTRIAAIDVGTTKVCTIIADNYSTGGLRILGVGIAPSRGMHKAMVVDINQTKQSIRESLTQAEQIAACKVESACVGVTGRHISSMNNRGTVAITRQDQVVRPGDLKRAFEVARNIVKVPNERRLLHAIPRAYKVDDQEGINNPLGMHGMRLDAETHIITGAITSIQNLTKCIRGVGVEVDELVLEPLASAEAVLNTDEKQAGVMLADIGGGTTDIAIFKDGTICHTSVLPVAGHQLTRDISIGLGLPFDLAEQIKRKYGSVLTSNNTGNSIRDKVREQATQTITLDGHSVSSSDLTEVIRMRVEELLRLLLLELPQTDCAKFIPAGIVLTGGGTNLPGIAELGEKVTRLPVRVGVPNPPEGVSDMLRNPAYATAIGLLLWKAGNNRSHDFATREPGLRRLLSRVFRIFR